MRQCSHRLTARGLAAKFILSVIPVMALSKQSAECQLPQLPDKPNQPTSGFNFSKREYGKKVVVKLSLEVWMVKTWPWLHHSEEKDAVFYHVCLTAVNSKKLTLKNSQTGFLTKGFSNWKPATVPSVSHVSQTSGGGYDCPAYSLQRRWWAAFLRTSQAKGNWQQRLLKILSNLIYLSR